MLSSDNGSSVTRQRRKAFMCPWQRWCITGCLPSRWQHETTCMFYLLFIHWEYNVMLHKIIFDCIINVKLAGGDPYQFWPFLQKRVKCFTNILMNKYSKLKSSQHHAWMAPKFREGDLREFKSQNVPGVQGACPQSPLEARTFGVCLGNQAVFILFICTWLGKTQGYTLGPLYCGNNITILFHIKVYS